MRQVEQHKYGNYKDFLNPIVVNDNMEHKPTIRQSEDQYKQVDVKKDDRKHNISTINEKLVHEKLFQEKLKLREFELSLRRNYQAFQKGDIFKLLHDSKSGTVIRLKDDEYELTQRKSNPSNYFYGVDYDDGSFSSYEDQNRMIEI